MIERVVAIDDLPQPADWKGKGACASSGKYYEVFFPEGRRDEIERKTEIAKEFCRVCPVVSQCPDYAMKHRIEHGI